MASSTVESRIKDIANDVSYLKQDMAVVGNLVDRLDTTIDRLTDISNSVSTLLSVHEEKITAQEVLSKNIHTLIEKRRDEMENKVEQLHARISSGEKELANKIDQQYDDILFELKEMRKESTEQHRTLSGRITTLEKWMWVFLGGGAIVAAVLSIADLSSLFQ